MVPVAKLVLLVAALVATDSCLCVPWDLNIIGIPKARATEEDTARLQEGVATPMIHALRPLLGSLGDMGQRAGVSCDSWRLAVEVNNKRDWKTVPANCKDYVGRYMLGLQYRQDSRAVVDEAIAYAQGLKLAGKHKEVWVFDVDETSLSTLPYYAKEGFGTKLYNATSFNEYVLKGTAPALPETLRLFKKLISLGIKPVFLSGRSENQRIITVANHRRQGYSGWEKLVLKPAGFKGTAIAFKSGERQKLQNAGYVIVGNIGDQWSDILGVPEGPRTFKLPDPMYYIG